MVLIELLWFRAARNLQSTKNNKVSGNNTRRVCTHKEVGCIFRLFYFVHIHLRVYKLDLKDFQTWSQKKGYKDLNAVVFFYVEYSDSLPQPPPIPSFSRMIFHRKPSYLALRHWFLCPACEVWNVNQIVTTAKDIFSLFLKRPGSVNHTAYIGFAFFVGKLGKKIAFLFILPQR